jgi:hypothetical protein
MTNKQIEDRIRFAADPEAPTHQIAAGVSAKTGTRIEKHAARLGLKTYGRPARHDGFMDIEVDFRDGQPVRIAE